MKIGGKLVLFSRIYPHRYKPWAYQVVATIGEKKLYFTDWVYHKNYKEQMIEIIKRILNPF